MEGFSMRKLVLDVPHGNVVPNHWWLMGWGFCSWHFFKIQWGYAQQTSSNSIIQCGDVGL